MDDPHKPASASADDDAFAPLTDADRTRAEENPSGDGEAGDDDLVMLPCLGEMPPREYFRLRDGRVPTYVWAYRNEDGKAMVVAARYDATAPDGSPTKEVRPWTYGQRRRTNRNGERQVTKAWHAKAPPVPRPIYGLDRLATRLEAPVLVTEGEKAADAAGTTFPEMVAVTSQGGSHAADKSDWTPLRDRHVTVWPDNDDAGAGYGANVAELTKAAGAASVTRGGRAGRLAAGVGLG